MRKYLHFFMIVTMTVVLAVMPVYAATTDEDIVTVNITVDRWIEMAVGDPDTVSLNINSSENKTEQASMTVKANDGSWILRATPNWGIYDGQISFAEGGSSANRHFQRVAALYNSNVKTPADGIDLTMNIEIWPTSWNGQAAELLGPDDGGSFTIDLLAYYGN